MNINKQFPEIPSDVTGGNRRFAENIRLFLRDQLPNIIQDYLVYKGYDHLIDDSLVDSYHRHSELSTCDGDMVALQIDADGNEDLIGYATQTGIFAGVHLEDGSSAQSIPNGTTYTKITKFSHNGESSNCTPDVTNNKIIATIAGRYKCHFEFYATSGTNNVTYKVAAFLNGTEQHQVHGMKKWLAAGDHSGCSGDGFIDISTVPWDVDLRIKHDNGGAVNITPVYMSLTLQYLGKT
jgi:hypothetical protein